MVITGTWSEKAIGRGVRPFSGCVVHAGLELREVLGLAPAGNCRHAICLHLGTRVRDKSVPRREGPSDKVAVVKPSRAAFPLPRRQGPSCVRRPGAATGPPAPSCGDSVQDSRLPMKQAFSGAVVSTAFRSNEE